MTDPEERPPAYPRLAYLVLGLMFLTLLLLMATLYWYFYVCDLCGSVVGGSAEQAAILLGAIGRRSVPTDSRNQSSLTDPLCKICAVYAAHL